MAAADIATARLVTEEGFRATAYTDTTGNITIGYGFNVSAGISQFAAASLLAAQVHERDQFLQSYSWYQNLDPVRQSVFIDVSFNVGVGGLLHFPKCIAAVSIGDWQTAHDELLNSLAAKQLPSRYNTLAQILLTGQA